MSIKLKNKVIPYSPNKRKKEENDYTSILYKPKSQKNVGKKFPLMYSKNKNDFLFFNSNKNEKSYNQNSSFCIIIFFLLFISFR